MGVDGWGSSLKIPKRKGDAGDASKARPAGGDVEDVREGQLGTEDCGAGVSSVSPRARKQRRKTIGVQRFGDWFAGDIEARPGRSSRCAPSVASSFPDARVLSLSRRRLWRASTRPPRSRGRGRPGSRARRTTTCPRR